MTLETDVPNYKDNPYSEPTALIAEFLPSGIAYLKVSLFPGKIGIDFANELDSIFSGKFANAERLIIDLRGQSRRWHRRPHSHELSHPGPRSLSAIAGTEKWPKSAVIPPACPFSTKSLVRSWRYLASPLKFLGKTSVFVHTEGLGRRPYQGRVAILVNRHTTGAAEMVAQFAQENRLATIAGEKTPGRLVTRSAFKLGSGYRLVIPVAAYVSAKGNRIEAVGITPEVPTPWDFRSAASGEDDQLLSTVGQFANS